MTIQNSIRKTARKQKRFQVADILRATEDTFSRQYISSVLKTMVETGELVRAGEKRYTFYGLPRHINFLSGRVAKIYANRDLEEHTILFAMERALVGWSRIRDNVRSIVEYGFQEMVNNAIEHSRSKRIRVAFNKIGTDFQFTVRDLGVGVFRNVIKKRTLGTEFEAIQDLLKGKTTTAPKAHSGEGIFFTSKAADLFTLESFGYRLRVDNLLPDVFIEETAQKHRGTEATFRINLKSARHLKDIFHAYQANPDEYAFDKTEILVKLYLLGTIYISRSQARRLLTGLEKFKTIILDFAGVPTVGQAFADEIFRVFQSKHPEIALISKNMNAAITFMVGRVEKPRRH